jgi:hypothetical protein
MAEKLITNVSSGCIRIIVEIGEKQSAGDFPVATLPQWIENLETPSGEPLVQGSEMGAVLACKMAFKAVLQEEWDLACIAALWIILHAPGQKSITVNDLRNMADIGVLRIMATADGSVWRSEISLYSSDTAITIH